MHETYKWIKMRENLNRPNRDELIKKTTREIYACVFGLKVNHDDGFFMHANGEKKCLDSLHAENRQFYILKHFFSWVGFLAIFPFFFLQDFFRTFFIFSDVFFFQFFQICFFSLLLFLLYSTHKMDRNSLE